MPARPTSEREFILERLHSLSGIVPIGAFLVLHLASGALAIPELGGSKEAYDRAALALARHPAAKLAIELGLVALPLAFHAAYGAVLALRTRPARLARGEGPLARSDLAFLIQRATGAFLVAYIVVHALRERIGAGRAPHEVMASSLANDAYLAFSCAGVLAASFHLAHGLWSFTIRFGLALTAPAQRRVRYACCALFVGLAALGLAALAALRGAGGIGS